MATLGLGQMPIVMRRYPHMLPGDVVVWSEFLREPVARLAEVWYDVHVGNGLAGDFVEGSLDSRIAQGIYRKRIDVVCRVGGGYWVVEVKPRGDMTALGQAIAYRDLFVQEYEVDGDVIPVVVCGEVDDDLIGIYDERGVGLIAV